jgi:hypothetical protein
MASGQKLWRSAKPGIRGWRGGRETCPEKTSAPVGIPVPHCAPTSGQPTPVKKNVLERPGTRASDITGNQRVRQIRPWSLPAVAACPNAATSDTGAIHHTFPSLPNQSTLAIGARPPVTAVPPADTVCGDCGAGLAIPPRRGSGTSIAAKPSPSARPSRHQAVCPTAAQLAPCPTRHPGGGHQARHRLTPVKLVGRPHPPSRHKARTSTKRWRRKVRFDRHRIADVDGLPWLSEAAITVHSACWGSPTSRR